MPLVNLLCSQTQNAKIIFATDEWFACAHNLLQPNEPTFDPDAYCPEGKVMDGWETRRKRTPGHDWCLISLGTPQRRKARLVRMEVDTAHFTGNYVPRISVQGSRGGEGLFLARNEYLGRQGSCASVEEIQEAERICAGYEWVDILKMTELKPGYEETRHSVFEVGQEASQDMREWGFIRLNYFPDGGVARLKLWAEVEDNDTPNGAIPSTLTPPPHQKSPPSPPLIDYASAKKGGRGIGCSNRHYGVPSNLLKDGRGVDMGDGWETARHTQRPPILKLIPGSDLVDFADLEDWAVVELGRVLEGGVRRIVIDTAHFKGNFPESVLVEGCFFDTADVTLSQKEIDDTVCRDKKVVWFPLLERVRVGPDAEHFFEKEIVNGQRKVSHVRVTIYPDGGLSRMRIFGHDLGRGDTSFQRSYL